LRYVDHQSFDDPADRAAILAPLADPAGEEMSPRLRIAPLPNGQTKAPILSREHEAHLFRKMNYLKCRADRLSEQAKEERPSPVILAEIERLQSEAQAVKNRIVEMNLPLVIFVVRKRIRAGQELSELRSQRGKPRAHPGRGPFRFRARKSFQHLCDLGDPERPRVEGSK
jgi:RNA polymerase primary sigma factor